MSQKAQPQKPDLWRMVLIFTTVYLAFSLFTMHRTTDSGTAAKSADEIMNLIRKEAQDVRDYAAKNKTTIATALSVLGQIDPSPIADLRTPFEKLSADQDLEQMRILNGFVCDTSIRFVENAYENRIDGLKDLSKARKEELKLQAQMLVVDTQLKAAGERSELQRLIAANDTITHLGHYYDSQPIWDQPIPVEPSPQYPQTQVTPAQLKQKLGTLSTQLGKTTPVWGFFPGYQMVDFIVHLTGAIPGFSYWITALILAIVVRGSIFPISQRQMMWSRQMSQLNPLITEIKKEYKNDSQQSQMKIMELYKEYGMNPLAGCLPAFIQMPLYILVYDSMLNYRFEFQRGTFLWINPGTSAWSHGFIARNLGEKDYILIVIYAISMVTTALLSPVQDPSNMRQQRLMGVTISGMFGILMFFWQVPSAFILYWICSNILATAQSLRAYRLPLPPLVKKNAPNGGVYPVTAGRLGPSKDGLPANGTTNGRLNGKPKSTGAPKVHKPKKKK